MTLRISIQDIKLKDQEHLQGTVQLIVEGSKAGTLKSAPLEPYLLNGNHPFKLNAQNMIDSISGYSL